MLRPIEFDLSGPPTTEYRNGDLLGRLNLGLARVGRPTYLPTYLPTTFMLFLHDADQAFPDESVAVVSLAWGELFDLATPDSYRPRLYDSYGLVEELSSLADLTLQDKRWSRHLKLVQDELRCAAETEVCWLKQNPWSAGIIKKISSVSVTEVAQIKDLANLFVSTSPDIVNLLFECLRHETLTLPRNKRKTLAVLKLLGTQAIRRRFTASDVALDYPDALHDDRQAIVQRLQGLFEAETRKFHCVVHLRGDASHIHSLFDQNGFRQARKKDFPLEPIAQEFKRSINPQTTFRYETKAISHLAAAAHAVQACRRVIDLFNLYRNRSSIELDSNVLVFDGQRTTIVTRHTEQSLATQPSKEALKLTRKALQYIQFKNDRHLGLENSLEQHSLALSSGEPKASLVGIWTALECLVGSDGRDSSIKRIVEWIAPIVALRRVEKISRYLAVSCHEYLKAISKRPSRLLSRSSQYYFSPRDVLDAITGPEDNALLLQLLQDVSDHPLLRFRIYYAWKNFHEPKLVRRNLLASKQRLHWHLERIYRSRNLTVHKGMTPPFVPELVDRAQHYFTRCVTRVLDDLKKHPTWTVHTAMEQHRQRFHFVIGHLETVPQEIPAKFLFPSDEEFLECFPWKLED